MTTYVVTKTADVPSTDTQTFQVVQDAINVVAALPDGGRVFLKAGTYTENITVPTKVSIWGEGYTANLVGSCTFTGNYSVVKDLRITGNVTFNSGTIGNKFVGCWGDTGNTVTNLGT
jgi:pectin methylesterase-like acyl-CoA thioesterase